MRGADADFILAGSDGGRQTVYVRRPGAERPIWTAYDVAPQGELTNPRVVFAHLEPSNWRGLPEIP
jgi:hypothetical protein